MVKSPQVCWLYYCYIKWLLRVILPAPEGCPTTSFCTKKLLEVLRVTSPLLTLILRDSVMTHHRSLLTSVQRGTKYINLSKTKSTSLMDSLAGFMKKDSSSDGEDPSVGKVDLSHAESSCAHLGSRRTQFCCSCTTDALPRSRLASGDQPPLCHSRRLVPPLRTRHSDRVYRRISKLKSGHSEDHLGRIQS